MDAWALRKCGRPSSGAPGLAAGFCHDDEGSPESRLVGCAIQTCGNDAIDVRNRLRGHESRALSADLENRDGLLRPVPAPMTPA
jgi:hypothetical protein